MATWQELIEDEMKRHGESFDDCVSSTLTSDDVKKEFDDGYGGSEGCSFTLWTKRRVYFPVVYDGSEWVRSVPREPCDEKTEHVGGE